MKNTLLITTLMLGCSLATMTKADTSKDNCERVAGEGNCHVIPNNPYYPTEGYSDTTYYALSGPEGNQTMTIYGTTGEGSAAASVPRYAFLDEGNWASTLPSGITSLKTSGSVDIGSNAFAYARGLTSVDLTGVQTIGTSAFYGATGLTSFNLTGVQTIGTRAFYGATGLTSANLTGVQTIEHNAFAYATSLTSIIISDSLLDSAENILGYSCDVNNVCAGVDPYAFKNSGLNTIYCPAGKDCENSFTGLSSTPTIVSYSVDGNGQIKAGGKTYASLDDLANGNHIKKRIYTLDEANEVTGTKNRVSIRYR